MPSLKTEGFAELVREVAETARSAGDAGKAVGVALTLGDRLCQDIGWSAVTAADRVVLDEVRRRAVRLDPDAADRLFLTGSGRLTLRLAGAAAPARAHMLGGLGWEDDPGELRQRWQARHEEAVRDLAALHAEFAAEPRESVLARLDRIEFSLVHMAPVLIYVEDRTYSNLMKLSNLPGKSLPVGHPDSVLTRLRERPVAEWAVEDACFVACLDALLCSGPPVRAEEFNGAQLVPATLDRFLADRIVGYGAPPAAAAGRPTLARLRELAATCNRLRAEVLAAGSAPYRVINGLNLHKRERLMAAPTGLADLPEPVVAHLRGLLAADLGPRTPLAGLPPLFAGLAARLAGAAGDGAFSTAFEGVLHGLLTAVAEGFDADVAMSRGPQRFDPLRADPGDGADPLALGTGDFYCCVAPRRAMVERFAGDGAGLARVLAAYSARMRFNTWHYLPHTLSIVEREPGRDDWFFAPTMPDVTTWSDQHHTGHVAFGVRYAIRVPIGIEYDRRPLPGLYDLRLMRTSAPPFTVDDLRMAMAAGAVLRHLYQAMAPYEPVVTDFGRDWYQRFHG